MISGSKVFIGIRLVQFSRGGYIFGVLISDGELTRVEFLLMRVDLDLLKKKQNMRY